MVAYFGIVYSSYHTELGIWKVGSNAAKRPSEENATVDLGGILFSHRRHIIDVPLCLDHASDENPCPEGIASIEVPSRSK